MRKCGDCQLCCKLLPVARRDNRVADLMLEAKLLDAKTAATSMPSFEKLAGERCPHQRHHKGCAVYPNRPLPCRLWDCRWLINDDTADLHRPDRAHYVLDVMPDFVHVDDANTGEMVRMPVVQIWVDPDYPDAHRDPKLRDYIARQPNTLGLVRFDSKRAITLIPPSLSTTKEWIEVESNQREQTHTPAEIAAVMRDAV